MTVPGLMVDPEIGTVLGMVTILLMVTILDSRDVDTPMDDETVRSYRF